MLYDCKRLEAACGQKAASPTRLLAMEDEPRMAVV